MMVLFLVLIVIAVAAPRYGVDSRTPLGARRGAPPRPATWSRSGRRLPDRLRSG